MKTIYFFITTIAILTVLLLNLTTAQIPTLRLNETNATISQESIIPILKLKTKTSVSNVNSSDFWDDLDSPSDISGSEYWYNHSSWVESVFLKITDFFTKKADDVYLYNDTDTIYFNETKLNETIGNFITTSYVNTSGDIMTGDLNMSGNKLTDVGELIMFGVLNSQDIIPSINDTYSLGNTSNYYSDVYSIKLHSENVTTEYLDSEIIKSKNITAEGNITIAEYTFSNWIGSELDRITKGWFTDIDVSGEGNINKINATTLNTTGLIYSGDNLLISGKGAINGASVDSSVGLSVLTDTAGFGGSKHGIKATTVDAGTYCSLGYDDSINQYGLWCTANSANDRAVYGSSNAGYAGFFQGKVSISENLTVTEDVIANKFYGDGSQLTNIDINPFDQDLNTTNNATFSNLTLTGTIFNMANSSDLKLFNNWQVPSSVTDRYIYINYPSTENISAIFRINSWTASGTKYMQMKMGSNAQATWETDGNLLISSVGGRAVITGTDGWLLGNDGGGGYIGHGSTAPGTYESGFGISGIGSASNDASIDDYGYLQGGSNYASLKGDTKILGLGFTTAYGSNTEPVVSFGENFFTGGDLFIEKGWSGADEDAGVYFLTDRVFIDASDDSYVDEDDADQNNNEDKLHIYSGEGVDRYIYLKFSTASIPANSTIKSAKIMMHGYTDSVACDSDVYYVTSADWTEGVIKWSNKPTGSDTGADMGLSTAGGGVYSDDISSIVQGWVNSSYNNYGVYLVPTEAGQEAIQTDTEAGEEYARAFPQLVVEYYKESLTYDYGLDEFEFSKGIKSTATNDSAVGAITYGMKGVSFSDASTYGMLGYSDTEGGLSLGYEVGVYGTASGSNKAGYFNGDVIINSGNLTIGDRLCNSTNCYTLQQFLTDTGGGMDYTNLALTNISETFDENLIITKNLTVDSTTFHVDSDSNKVGIATLSPTHELNVVGNVNITGTSNLGGQVTLSGGTISATPTPQIQFGNYYDSEGAVSVSHIALYSNNYGFGITPESVNYISAKYHKFYGSGDLTSPAMTIDATSGSVDVDVAGKLDVVDYITAPGGVHVGGTSDPTTDTLVVDGASTLTGGFATAGHENIAIDVITHTVTSGEAGDDYFEIDPSIACDNDDVVGIQVAIYDTHDDVYANGGSYYTLDVDIYEDGTTDIIACEDNSNQLVTGDVVKFVITYLK